MEYDDIDDDDKYSDYDDMGDLFILDEMDREDERMNRGGGCLSVLLLMTALPFSLIYLTAKFLV